MGGDGGVFAVNRKFFAACRNTSKDGQSDATENEERQIKLNKRFVKCRTCAISNEELVEPIVTCRLGYLYTKENLIRALLDKTLHSSFSHIKGLKSVKEVIMTPNSEYSSGSDSSDGGSGSGSVGKEDSQLASRFMCPVTQLPFNGLYSFVAIWSTGHVLSEKALREIGAEGLQTEYGPFSAGEGDVVGLLPPEEELSTRRATLQAQAEVAKKKAKEEKKRARGARQAAEGEGEGEGEGERPHKSAKQQQQQQQATKATPSSLSSSSGAGLGSIAEAARSSVARSKGQSAVFDQLFHKQRAGEVKSGSEMFFSVAGIRYTL
jgi:Skp family chaperone for outer membrane proteins